MLSVPDDLRVEKLEEQLNHGVLSESQCKDPSCDEESHDLYVSIDFDEDPRAAADAVAGIEFVHTTWVGMRLGMLAKFDIVDEVDGNE